MNSIVLALSMGILATQAVSWADCCCGSFCQHKNECTGCGPEDACPGGARKSSCCDEDSSKPARTCSHQEPSSEIDRVPIDEPPTPQAALAPLILVEPPTAAPSVEVFRAPMDTGPPLDALPRQLSPRVLLI